ncbi:MAG TPA: glycoside hydrolase family 2 [Saprospiraceae bacterium]|nr:glycoside hydrolase family 2 [Saprospiraceae bacterium]
MLQKTKTILLILFLSQSFWIFAQEGNAILELNGIVDFEQTENAFPPTTFTRKIPVPGLIDLAEPKIEQYDLYFSGQHEPRYNWYRFNFYIEEKYKDKFSILKILKSRYNTQIIMNGKDVGTYMQCSVPIDCDLTPFMKFGEENELLIRLGERAWLPKEAATGFDREKYSDIPGIWDDLFIEFVGPIKIHRALALPDLKNNKVTLKLNLENYAKIVERNMEYSEIEYSITAFVREKKTQKLVSDLIEKKSKISCQSAQTLEFDISVNNPIAWSPEHPFLYEVFVVVDADRKFYNNYGNKESIRPKDDQVWIGASDEKIIPFGMRDFESVGKDFYLNGKPYYLFGSTITLNRFFEDRDRAHLPWDREWVENLMINIPKALRWNFFRVSIGLLPSFWYDLADEHGIVIQNEYLMWNLRGRPSQYKKEYTDWIWQDGNHPSIIIWDALNEQKQEYIGRKLIPELRKLDPTRIWDLGYMKAEATEKLAVNEIHWYPLAHGWWVNDAWYAKHIPAFRFGEVTKKYAGIAQFNEATSPIIVNEFGWQWQSRDGLKSGIRTFGNFTNKDITPYKKNYESYEPDGSQLYKNRDIYKHFLGDKSTDAKARRNFQAYILAIESEILRSTREADGMATFTYLVNNNGYTGDWFADNIADLKATPALLAQYHTTRPFAVFVDVQDARYLENPSHYKEGEEVLINLFAVNDFGDKKKGDLVFKLLDENGNIVFTNEQVVEVDAFWQKSIPVEIKMPSKAGGYLLISYLKENGLDDIPQVSRRYINVGELQQYNYFDYEYELPKNWPK